MGAGRSRRPTEGKVTRRYRDDTLILETEFTTADGAVTLIDFMPLRDGGNPRSGASRRGSTRPGARCPAISSLRFDYGSAVPWVTRLEDGALRAIAGPDMIVLRTPVELHGEDLTTVGEFTVVGRTDGSLRS